MTEEDEERRSVASINPHPRIHTYIHTFTHRHTLTLGKVVLSKMPYKHLEMSKENKNKPLTEAKEA